MIRGKYAIMDTSGSVISIVDADNLIEAVGLKHHVQRTCNETHGCDEVFMVAEATAKEVRNFKVEGFMVMPRKGTPR